MHYVMAYNLSSADHDGRGQQTLPNSGSHAPGCSTEAGRWESRAEALKAAKGLLREVLLSRSLQLLFGDLNVASQLTNGCLNRDGGRSKL